MSVVSGLPDPPYGPEVDVRNLDGFMLNVERLMASELVALSSHEVIAAALFLWCRAWKQLPAASLPDDDRVIAAFSRLPSARFTKLKGEMLRGFYKCRDGRLYHKMLSAEALVAYGRKQSFHDRRHRDAERLRLWRSKQDRNATGNDTETPSETRSETNAETRFVREGQDRDGTGTGPKEEGGRKNAADPPQSDVDDSAPKVAVAKPKRGRPAKADTEWPNGFELTPDMATYATNSGFDPPQLFEKFRNKSQAKGWRYKDWTAAFRNFASTERSYAPTTGARANGAWRPPDC